MGTAQLFAKKVFHNGEMDKKTDEINVSMYDVHYSEWTKWFSKEQILIVDGDNLKVNPADELRSVEKFLQIPHFFENGMISSSTGSGSKKQFLFKLCQRFTEQKSENVGTQFQLDASLLSENISMSVATFLQLHAQNFCRMASVNYTWCTDIYLNSRKLLLHNDSIHT